MTSQISSIDEKAARWLRGRGSWITAVLVVLIPYAAFLIVDGYGPLLHTPHLFMGGQRDTLWDLHQRSLEEGYVRVGKNPNNVALGVTPPGPGDKPWEADYPPWAQTICLLFTLPSFDATRLLFAGWDLLALVVLGIYAWKAARRFGWQWAVLAVASILAVGVNRAILGFGEYSIIVCGFLAAAVMTADDSRWEWLGGLAVGISLLKFSIALPFCCCFLVTGRWRTLVVAAGVVILASLINWQMTHVTPWRAFSMASDVGVTYATSSPTPLKAGVKVAAKFGLSTHVAAAGTAAVFAVVGGVVMWFYRRRGLVVLFGVAAVFARLWTYHLYYDDMMLMFLIVPLLVLTAKAPPGRRWRELAVFFVVGLSLWATAGNIFRWPVVVLQNLIWIGGTVFLLGRGGEDRSTRAAI